MMGKSDNQSNNIARVRGSGCGQGGSTAHAAAAAQEIAMQRARSGSFGRCPDKLTPEWLCGPMLKPGDSRVVDGISYRKATPVVRDRHQKCAMPARGNTRGGRHLFHVQQDLSHGF